MRRTKDKSSKSTSGQTPNTVRKRSFSEAGLNEIVNVPKRQKIENKKLTKCEEFYSEFKILQGIQGGDPLDRMSRRGFCFARTTLKFDWYNGAGAHWNSDLMSICKDVNGLFKQNKFVKDIYQLILSSNNYIESFMVNIIISYFIDLRIIRLIQHIYNIKIGTFWRVPDFYMDENEKRYHNLMRLESLTFLSENYVFDNFLFENNAKKITKEIKIDNEVNSQYLISHLLFRNPSNDTYWDSFCGLFPLNEDKISDMLEINNIVKKYVINNSEWELYSIFIPTDFIIKHKTETKKEIAQKLDDQNGGYKYVVMHNKYENQMIVFWAQWKTDADWY